MHCALCNVLGYGCARHPVAAVRMASLSRAVLSIINARCCVLHYALSHRTATIHYQICD